MKLEDKTIERVMTGMLAAQIAIGILVLAWMFSRVEVSPGDVLDRMEEINDGLTALIEADIEAQIQRAEINEIMLWNELEYPPTQKIPPVNK